MIDAPALPPPAVVAPAPREVSFGLVAGSAPAGTRRVIVRVGERVLGDRPLRGPRFSLRVELPRSEVAVRVTAVTAAGRRSSTVVSHVVGLPSVAAPRAAAARLHAGLGRSVRALTRAFSGTSGVYVEDLASGYGAAWNAQARFPAASTLKLAIAVAVLRAEPRKPAARGETASLLHAMLVRSDNEAANTLIARIGGSGRVEELLRTLDLRDSLMYGGYEVEEVRRPAARAPIPIRVDSQPRFGVGKYTSAWDLARLARAIYLAAAGRGPLPQLGVTRAEARHLLWLLAHVGDGAKLGRFLGSSATLLHKAGWLATARHDNGLVVWNGGVFVAAVLTWKAGGVGPAADVLAGRVTQTARDVFRELG
ncbi:MAG TPA: serine hydrolase [Gaiellaceae bacterium]|nr:serine hydrolase [Gaiellaceae bacterium]